MISDEKGSDNMVKNYVSWRNRALTDEEILRSFREGFVKAEYQQGYDGSKTLIVRLRPEESPYGVTGPKLEFIDPELPCEANQSLSQPKLTDYPLFRGGFHLWPALIADTFKCFELGAYVLVGRYNSDANVFTIHNHGLDYTRAYQLLLTHYRDPDDEKQSKVADEIAKHALRASNFATKSDRICDVFVVNADTTLTRNGKPAKASHGMEAILDEVQKANFKPVLECCCVDDGVAYSDAWVVDWEGSVIPPSQVSKAPQRRVGKVKYWNDLRVSDICLTCTMAASGEVVMEAARINLGAKKKGNNVATELQRRRMYLIRKEIIAKLQQNYEACKEIISENFNNFPEWGELGQI